MDGMIFGRPLDNTISNPTRYAASRLVDLNPTNEDEVAIKYKGIQLCLNVLTQCLSGTPCCLSRYSFSLSRVQSADPPLAIWHSRHRQLHQLWRVRLVQRPRVELGLGRVLEARSHCATLGFTCTHRVLAAPQVREQLLTRTVCVCESSTTPSSPRPSTRSYTCCASFT